MNSKKGLFQEHSSTLPILWDQIKKENSCFAVAIWKYIMKMSMTYYRKQSRGLKLKNLLNVESS